MRLLVVEDDVRLADLLSRSLREAGYAVDVARDGEAAVTQVAINDYDAMVLDVALPRKDGFAVAREVRGRGKALPILMLTARDDDVVPFTQSEDYVAAATEAGAEATLVPVEGGHFGVIDTGSDAWAACVEVLDSIG